MTVRIQIQLASLYGSGTQRESACSTMYLFCVRVLPWSDIMASGRSWLVYVIRRQVLCSTAKLSGVQPLGHMEPCSQNLCGIGRKKVEKQNRFPQCFYQTSDSSSLNVHP